MKKALLSLLILSISILGYFSVPKFFTPETESSKDDFPVFFMSLPIVCLDSTDIPCLSVEIEGLQLIASLHLGYSGCTSFLSEVVQKIEHKSFIKTVSIHNIYGKELQRKIYKIPQLEIGKLKIFHPEIEEMDEFDPDAILISDKNGPSRVKTGGVGWRLFDKMVLYLDLSNFRAVLCNSLETLEERELSLDAFVKTSLFTDHNLLEFDTMTPQGSIRCLLSTGCTYNFINTDNSQQESIEKKEWDKAKLVTFSSFHIGGKNFGETIFHPLPTKSNLPVEAMIGMDFLLKHRVVLDLKNKEIYVSSLEDGK